jgi:beta-lactamase class A
MGMFRGLVAVAVGAALVGCSAAPAASPPPPTTSTSRAPAPADPAPLQAVEAQFGVRLGVSAVNVHTGQTMSYRDGERFPLLSTFKAYAAAALLHEHALSSGYFDKVLHWTEADLLPNSPTTSERVATGMTISELCAAAITVSDNTAGNLLLKELGGPAGLTAFAREIGDEESRLDRWEPELNTAVPGDARDTTTPRAWAFVLRSLVLEETLETPERQQFTEWLLANKTGDERIRAGLPAGWRTADKTGTGSYGTANDVGVVWTPDGTPIVLAIMTSKPTEDAESEGAPIAAAAKAVAEALA